jgi:hypothetical protein
MPSKCSFNQAELLQIRKEMRRKDDLGKMEVHIPKYTLVTSKTLLRNDGLGDYYETPEGDWNVLAVAMKNALHSQLILTHEFVEVILIQAAGIPEPVIDAWDAYFEVLRAHGLVGPDDEPGDDPRAPYYKQHQVASKIERIVCEEGFDLSWDEYEKACTLFSNP